MLAFGFANLPMLWWLAAASAPLVIHLWNRRKYREMPWAAMQYLLAAIRKNSRRVRIEQWLLLALRTLLIVLLVLAVAEFFFQRTGLKFAAGRRTHRLLVFDGSFSMAYKPADKSRFDRAKEVATQIVDEANQGDGFTLVLLSDPPRAVVGTPAFDRADFVREIENLALPHTTADLPATLVKVEEVLQAARRDQPRLEQEEVYFLTDLGKVGWLPELEGDAAVTEFRQRTERIARQAQLSVIDLGQAASDNLAVSDVRAVDPFATLAQEVAVEAEVLNLGRQPRTRQLVEFFVDGRRAGEDYVDVDGGERKLASFAYRFDAPGDHAIEARLAADLLDVDNHRWLSLPVKEFIRVLCVDGRPSGKAFGGAADYLAVALAPEGRHFERSLVRPEVVSESALSELELDQYECIFLANVAQFTTSEARLLEKYVQAGGGLVFFLGDQVQAESYNQQLAGDGPNGVRVLPVRLGAAVEEGLYKFDPLDYRHPLVSSFQGQTSAGLITTLITRYIKLETLSGSQARVALTFIGGNPAIVEERIGLGRSIVVATSADTSWTSMPTWSSYVPIVQELLSATVGGQLGERNWRVGQPLSEAVASVSGDARVEIETPAGKREQVRLAVEGDEHRWTWSDTFQSGPYHAQLAAPNAEDRVYAVNVDTVESDLAKLEVDDLRNEVWPGIDFAYNTDWRNLGEQPTAEISRRGGLQRWFLYPALLLLFAEPLLAWLFGHQRS